MSDNKLGKIRNRKAEMLIRNSNLPKEIIVIKENEQFTQLLKDFPDKIVVIYFWANSCAPCKIYRPIFEIAHQKFSMDYVFAKINADENPDIAQSLGVTSIPTTVLAKGNQVIRRFMGVINLETLKHIFENFKA
ncbi:MAG: thioredoxin family protein [Promethearchaeota archaeon]